MKFIIPRGLDLTDESLYVLNAKYPKSIEFGSTYYHVLTSQLWSIAGNIVNFRLIGLLIVLVASFSIAGATWSLTRNAQNDYWYLLLLLSLSGSFALIYGSLLNYSPSYNQLVLLFGSLGLASSIYLAIFVNPITRSILWVIYGSSITWAGLCKPSVLVPLWLLCVLVRLAQKKSVRRFLLSEILSLLFIFASASILYLILLKDYLTISQIKIGLLVLGNLQEMNALQVFGLNISRTFASGAVAIGFLCLFYLVRLLNFPLLRRFDLPIRSNLIYAAIAFLGLFWVGGSDRWKSQSTLIHFTLFLLLTLVINDFKIDSKFSRIVSVLFLFPYALSIGTNNLYFAQVLFYLGCWGSAIGIIIYKSTILAQMNKVVIGITTTLMIVLLMQQLTYIGRNSYGLLLPYSSNNTVQKVTGTGSLRLDPETIAMVRGASRAREDCNIGPRDKLISTDALSGLSLLLDMEPAGAAWINDEKTLRLVSDLEITRDSNHVIWAFRRENPQQRIEFMGQYSTKSFIKCAQFPFGSEDQIQLWRSN